MSGIRRGGQVCVVGAQLSLLAMTWIGSAQAAINPPTSTSSEVAATRSEEAFVAESGPTGPLRLPLRLEDDDGSDSGLPITLDFNDAPIRKVLAAFADFTGLNVIAGENVDGAVTMRLHSVPWRRAFDALLDARGLSMQRRGNVIWVAPAADLAVRERQLLESEARRLTVEPLVSRSFELRYQRAEDVRALIAGEGGQRMLTKRGLAAADIRTNALFVTDRGASVDNVASMLALIDRPVKQVLIEARIVEADDGVARNLGVRLGNMAAEGGPIDVAAPGNSRATAQGQSIGSKQAAGTPGDKPLPALSFAAGPLDGVPAAALAMTLFRAGLSPLLSLELSALESDGKGRVLASPRVVTADRAKAIIEQGTELPYQAKVGNGVSAVQFRKAGLRLEVTPHITPRGHVTLDVDVSKDSIGRETLAGPAIDTRHVHTTVRVDDGGTVAIGGIYMHSARTDVARVPWLGKLPLIGALFRRHAQSDRKSELVVFLTPTVVPDFDSAAGFDPSSVAPRETANDPLDKVRAYP
ncbi:MAG: type IV pilus secretin PilQ [Janthinobacterium lividum]